MKDTVNAGAATTFTMTLTSLIFVHPGLILQLLDTL